MLKLAVFFILFSSLSYGQFPFIKIENVNGEYTNEQGRAHASKAKYKISKVQISHEDIYLDFNKKEKNLVIKDDTTTVELDFDFSFLNIFKAFSFKHLQIDSTEKVFALASGDVDLYIAPKRYTFSNFFIETDVREIELRPKKEISIIDGLVLNAGFNIGRIVFSNFERKFFNDLKLENPSQKKEIELMRRKGEYLEVPMVIRSVQYSIHKGSFKGLAKIDSYINLWFNIFGNIVTNESNTHLKITISKATLGYFSVRNTILNMVRNLKLDGVTVIGNCINVDLEDVALGK